MLIILEGIDGSGTTTQAELLAKRLNEAGHKALATGEPTQLEIGKLAKEVLQHKWETSPEALQLLFCADRADHLWNEIEPALNEGAIIISDRFFWSTIAFGSLKCDKKWLKNICQTFPEPDMIIYLQIEPEEAIKRIDGRGERELFEKIDTLREVNENFQELIAEKYKAKEVIVLDATENMNKICDQIYELIITRT